MAQLLSSIVNKIKSKENFGEELNQLPIDSIDKDNSDTLISCLINQAFDNNNKQAVRDVVITFDKARVKFDPLPMKTALFLNPLIDREILEFILTCFPERKSVDYFLDLINLGDDQTALKTAKILDSFFTEDQNWPLLVKLTEDVEDEEYENQLLRAFFQMKVSEINTFVDCPEWIKFDLPETEIPKVPDYIPSVKEAVELLMNDLESKGFIFEVKDPDLKHRSENIKKEIIKNCMISQYAISTVTEKIQMLNAVKPFPMFIDDVIFREYGPVNSVYTHSPELIDPSSVCAEHGGCRMFLCNEFEEIDPNGDQIDPFEDDTITYDWFRGICDICFLKIKKRQYAVREPLSHGGWRGCYCSFKCMESIIKNPNTLEIIQRIEGQLKLIGIRDR